MPDTLLFTAVTLLAAAPLAGVCAAARGTGDGRRSLGMAMRTSVRLVVAAAIFACSSALVTGALGAWSGHTMPALLEQSGALGVTGAMLALFGAVCGTRFTDVLDAAGTALAAVTGASFAVLVAGSVVAQAPRPVIEWALTASPLVALASVAHIDLVRTDTLYQVSPLAHLQVDLPTWPVVCGLYLAVTATCFVELAWHHRPDTNSGRLSPRTERTLA